MARSRLMNGAAWHNFSRLYSTKVRLGIVDSCNKFICKVTHSLVYS